MRKNLILLAVLAFGAAQGASAEVLDGKAAKKALFPATGASVQVMKQAFLADGQAEILGSVAAEQPYYGAIAVSPDEGLMSEATIAAANYHSVEAASAAAAAGCDAARKGAAACVIVALVRPKGWEAWPLQLSADATAAFRKDYGGKGSALAVSAGTGAWGMAKGNGAAEAAVAACAKKLTGPNDCAVVVAD
jgi:hypothetical protein